MFAEMAKKVIEKRITYLGEARLTSIGACISDIKLNKIPGDFVEFGIALGGSGICIANELDDGRRYVGFDVFGMIPPPTDKDGPGPLARYEVPGSPDLRS
jgi:asparagine synthase (glutamine-hydrolysing)